MSSNANDTTAALMAVSTPATAADSKENTIFQCIVTAFDQEGLHHISSQTAKIVWGDIPQDVVVSLGDEVTDCLSGKGIDVPELATAFDALRSSNQVTVVSDLVAVIAQM
jgi:hypothetical protein